jgi:hypothetical protein
VIGAVIQDITNLGIRVSAIILPLVVQDNISLVIVVTHVHQHLGTDIIQRLIVVTGTVIVDTTNLGIRVSAIILPPVVQVSTLLAIVVIHVVLLHQMVTTQQQIHVIGAVIQDITNQGTLVSVITRTSVVLDSISLEALATHVTQRHQIHTIRRVVPVIGAVAVGILDQEIAVSVTTTITVL